MYMTMSTQKSSNEANTIHGHEVCPGTHHSTHDGSLFLFRLSSFGIMNRENTNCQIGPIIIHVFNGITIVYYRWRSPFWLARASSQVTSHWRHTNRNACVRSSQLYNMAVSWTKASPGVYWNSSGILGHQRASSLFTLATIVNGLVW